VDLTLRLGLGLLQAHTAAQHASIPTAQATAQQMHMWRGLGYSNSLHQAVSSCCMQQHKC
jgi:hypothetical protein